MHFLLVNVFPLPCIISLFLSFFSFHDNRNFTDVAACCQQHLIWLTKHNTFSHVDDLENNSLALINFENSDNTNHQKLFSSISTHLISDKSSHAQIPSVFSASPFLVCVPFSLFLLFITLTYYRLLKHFLFVCCRLAFYC